MGGGGVNARPQDRSCMILFVCFYLEGRAEMCILVNVSKEFRGGRGGFFCRNVVKTYVIIPRL